MICYVAESLAGPLFLVGALLLMYFLPWFIAHQRRHRNEMTIAVLNFFLGWTFIGWVICLAWAFSADVRQTAA